jgi:ribosomal protein S18 acetylase RimI-like enzyme
MKSTQRCRVEHYKKEIQEMWIRQAEKSDVKALSALAIATYSDAFGHTFSASDLALHLAQNFSEAYFARNLDEDIVLLAEEKGRLAGYVKFGAVSISVQSATSQDRELQRLYVQADFQRRGIGRSLMEAALTHPELAGAENIYLDVWDENTVAQKLYKSYGFEVIGKNPFIVDSRVLGYDLVMVRRPARTAS